MPLDIAANTAITEIGIHTVIKAAILLIPASILIGCFYLLGKRIVKNHFFIIPTLLGAATCSILFALYSYLSFLVKIPLSPKFFLAGFGLITIYLSIYPILKDRELATLSLKISALKEQYLSLKSKENLISEIVSLIFTAVFSTIFIKSFLIKYKSPLLPLTSIGEDTISHFNIFHLIARENSLLFGRTDLYDSIYSGLCHYPQGLHGFMYLLFKVLRGSGIIFENNFLSLFTVSIPLILIYLLIFLSLKASKRLGINNLLSKIFAPIMILILAGIYCVLPLHYASFYSQIAAYIALLLSLIVISDDTVSEKSKLVSVLLTDLLVTSCWFFLSPISSLIFFITLITSKAEWRFKIGALSCWGLGTALLLYLPLKYLELTNALNMPGGSPVLSIQIMLVMAFLIFNFNRPLFDKIRSDRSIQILIFFFIVTSLFSLSIYTYQIISTGKNSYYFYKSLYITHIALSIFTIPLIIHAIDRSDLKNNLLKGASLAIISMGLFVFFKKLPQHYNFTDWNAGGVKNISQGKIKAMLKLKSELPDVANTHIFAATDNFIEMAYLNRWLPIFVGSQIDYGLQSVPYAAKEKFFDELFKHIRESNNGKRYIVFDPDGYLAKSCNVKVFAAYDRGLIDILPKESRKIRISICKKIFKYNERPSSKFDPYAKSNWEEEDKILTEDIKKAK